MTLLEFLLLIRGRVVAGAATGLQSLVGVLRVPGGFDSHATPPKAFYTSPTFVPQGSRKLDYIPAAQASTSLWRLEFDPHLQPGEKILMALIEKCN